VRSESSGTDLNNLPMPDTGKEPFRTTSPLPSGVKLLGFGVSAGSRVQAESSHVHLDESAGSTSSKDPDFVTRYQEGSLRLTPEASAALDSAVLNFSRNLESRARYNTPDEVLQARDIKNAEGDLLASPVGTVIAQTVAWLRPAGFFCLGLTGPAMQAVLVNQPVQPGQFVIGFVGGAILGATWALDAQTVRIKRWWRARKETKALAQASSASTSPQKSQ
jgi:hypothetical protein